jgi:hypothetical protein
MFEIGAREFWAMLVGAMLVLATAAVVLAVVYVVDP